ncbi:iron complex transport system permease protein [Cricetibacter osteomyelitidis]|uniref:Iron complex transport system permease protein n=2 Tax=Cricetibacter osteomyelitidis TaxID=1521931 RepID=A0A4R2SW24_9PAST|nr:iron complex transport system permease protein [Cricetibacter osteomyelitidis]
MLILRDYANYSHLDFMIKRRYLILLLLIFSVVSLFIGVSTVNLDGLLALDTEQWRIFLISRLPRLISIIIAGAALSICGLVMQQLSRNRFVSPTTAGTMDSARLGILIAILLFPTASMLLKTVIAVVVSFIGTLLFMSILSRLKFKDTIFVPLVGIMFGNIISSITAFIAYQQDLLQNLSGWLQGDFSLVMAGRYELLYVSLPALIVAYLFANRFSIVGMGEDFATNLGLNYKQVLYLGLAIVATVSSIIIVSVGVIPFLGLIIPNLVTLYLGDNLKKVLSHTALLGAVFVLFCDILGRSVIYPYEISINAVVGVFGSAIFLYLLLKRSKYE